MLQYRYGWTGARIGAGVSVFNFLGSDFTGNVNTVNSALRTWFLGLASTIPDDVVITPAAECLQIDSATGELQDVEALTALANVAGTAGTAFSANTGTVTRWTTPNIVAGRRLSGRTFLIPRANVFGTTGSVASATITSDETLHTTLISQCDAAGIPLGVWSRTAGFIGAVNGGQTLARPSTLRTRND